ncbi:transporter substrate-binding domain-containing protein [Leifsonia sp. NPDC058194]|uniref:transporter substrate-binding domain-containing protein n=1 Tax=Leifsonia sp. NPDC058194 TaxID=3346374 RepID=UPI0036D92A7F
MSQHLPRRRRRTIVSAALVATALVASLAACSGQASASSTSGGSDSIAIGAHSNGVATETTVELKQVDSIRDKLPESVKKSGKLVIGLGALPSGFPPIAYVGDDQKTYTGTDPDLARLVAKVLGLEPEFKNATWQNLFIGIDNGTIDTGFSNITVTEERKQKYDFASYRQDILAFAVPKKSAWEFDGDYQNLAGLTVATDRGTNQEKILLEWQQKLQAEGKTLDIKYYPDANTVFLALNSGKIDAYFTPNPSVAYQETQAAKTANPIRTAGTFSGAGETVKGLIAATSKKGSGLAEPVAEAFNYVIEHGQYAKVLKAYNLENESVTTSEVNPAGLPLSNE